jgi:O-antigen/teichoic acid export membrane protein
MLQAGVGASVPVIISTQLSHAGLGFWGWSTIIAAPILTMLIAVQGVAMPALARLRFVDDSRSREATDLLLRLSVVLGAVGSMTFVGVAPAIVRYLFGLRWAGASGAVQISLLGVVPCAYVGVLTARLQAQGWVARRLRVFVVSGVVTLTCAWPLTHFAGVDGAAVASSLLLPTVDALLLAGVMHPPLRRSLIDLILAGGGMAALSLGAARLVAGMPSLLFVTGALCACAVAVACVVDRDVVVTTIRFVRLA